MSLLIALYACNSEGNIFGSESISVVNINDNYSFHFRLLSEEELVGKDLKTGRFATKNEALDNYKGHLYGQLNIVPADGQTALKQIYERSHSNEKAWEESKSDLLFNAREDINAYAGDLRIPCSLYHGQLAPFDHQGIQLSLVFKIPENEELPDENITVQFNDRFFTNRLISFPVQLH